MRNHGFQESGEKSGSRYIILTRYASEAICEQERNDEGSMKNFPMAFLPMKEIEESLLNE